MKTRIDSHSSTRFVWSVTKSRASRLFPPQELKAFHEAVLNEVLEERVVSSRSRCNPRGLKRKMSGYPLRPRKRSHIKRIEVKNHIKILK